VRCLYAVDEDLLPKTPNAAQAAIIAIKIATKDTKELQKHRCPFLVLLVAQFLSGGHFFFALDCVVQRNSPRLFK